MASYTPSNLLPSSPLDRVHPPPLITTPSLQRALTANTDVKRRSRSSSVLNVTKLRVNPDDVLDQGAGLNHNADWVNLKGAWLIHLFFLILGKVLLSIVPGMTKDVSWTILNLGYIFVSYVVFHGVKGVPSDLANNSGAYEGLTLWEQVDEGAHNTPAKKWLTVLPIGLFLLSTHYSQAYFTLNLSALVLVGLAPKLPYFHRLRFKFFDQSVVQEPSAPPTPVEFSMTAGEKDYSIFHS